MKILLRLITLLIFLIILSPRNINAQQEQPYELTKLNIEGNNFLDEEDIFLVLASQQSPNWFSQFVHSFTSFGEDALYFDSLLIPSDLEILKRYYRHNGFFNATFSYKYELDSENKEASLTYFVNEGEQIYFNNFEVAGIEKIRGEFIYYINELTKTDTTIRFSGDLVQSKSDQIYNYLRDKGFMLASVETPVIIVDTMKNKVDVKIEVKTGRRYIIDELRVQRTGENKELVEDELLKTIVNVDTGDYYNFYDLRNGQVRLFRTGLFTNVLVSGVIADTVADKVPLLISADVGTLYEISPEIIMNNENQVFNLGLGIGFTRKNFLGDARKLTVRASSAAQDISEFLSNPSISDTTIFGYADARVIIEQPILFGKSINTRLENYVTLQKRKDEYNQTLYGTKLSFDFELPQFVYATGLQTYFNWENSKSIFTENYVRSIFINAGYSDSVASEATNRIKQETNFEQQVTNTVLGVQLSAQKTNNLIFPTRGYAISILAEDGNSIRRLFDNLTKTKFEGPQYYKIIFTSSFYLPVYTSPENSFGGKFKVGYIRTYLGDNSQIPLNQRLFSGGSNSVRGWVSRDLASSEVSNIGVGSFDDLQQLLLSDISPGGFFTIEGSIETRNRLIGKVGSALFIDFGNTWNSYKNFQWSSVAIAAGFGFRYYSDFVPFRVDFGFKVYDPENRKSFLKKSFFDIMQFHLGIGEAF